jgi:predicted Zn-ribbon and HTH transcriptional regulator
MIEEKRICRKCGVSFVAIPGAEEPPECPECERTEAEKLEDTTLVTPPGSQAS